MIHVLAVLAFPGPADGGSVRAAVQRASDVDRDTTVDILCAAVGDGRLTLAELDNRVGAALSARTCTELAILIADIPVARRTPPAATPARPTELPQSRWSLIQSLIAV